MVILMMPNPFRLQTAQQPPLAYNSMAELTRLAADTQMPLSQLKEMAAAQGQMQAAQETAKIEIPQVNFYPSRHSNTRKARRQDIKQAYRLLKPTKRSLMSPRRWWFGGKYRYNKNTAQCCIDGCDMDHLIRVAGNIYDQFVDEETNHSLWDLYFKNPVTGEAEAFIARENVTSGRKMRGTYCPEHLHLYHLLCKWEKEEEREAEASTGTLNAKLKKGVSMVAVPMSVMRKKDDTPLELQKYAPFFDMMKADGIPIQRLYNSEGKNDIVMPIFDLRKFNGSPSLVGGESMASVSVPSVQTVPTGGLDALLTATQEQLPEV